jgi:hypothetical protein
MKDSKFISEYLNKIAHYYNKLNTSQSINDSEEQLISQYFHNNQFVTISSLENDNIEYANGVERVIGIKDKNFINKTFFEITDKQQQAIVIEYGIIAVSLLADKELTCNSKVSYTIEFNVILNQKTKENRRLERFIKLIDFREGKPTKHFDVWTDITYKPNNSEYVQYSFYVEEHDELEKIYERFQQKWFKRIGFKLSKNEILILGQLKKGISVSEISEIIKFHDKNGEKNSYLTEHTINTYIKKMYSRSNSLIEEAEFCDKIEMNSGGLYTGIFYLIKSEKLIKNYIQLLNFVEKYGFINLFNFIDD